MKISDIYRWAQDNEIQDLVKTINNLVNAGKVSFNDDEKHLWQSSTEFWKHGKSRDMVCVCVPFEEEVDFSGVVISEKIAENSPCTKISGTNMMFSKGIVGALNSEQIQKYCPTIDEVNRPNLKNRTLLFSTASKACREETKHLTGQDRVKSFLNCMSIKARKEKDKK